jgi:hypothetical protein
MITRDARFGSIALRVFAWDEAKENYDQPTQSGTVCGDEQ